jgi:integrase
MQKKIQILHTDTIEKAIKKFHVKKIKFALSKNQIDELLEKAYITNKKHWLMIKLELECGLRVSEVAYLRIENIVFNELEIHIQGYNADRYTEQWNPKTRSGNRIVPLSPKMSIELASYIGKRKKGYVFLSQKMRIFDPNNIPKRLVRYLGIYQSALIGKEIYYAYQLKKPFYIRNDGNQICEGENLSHFPCKFQQDKGSYFFINKKDSNKVSGCYKDYFNGSYDLLSKPTKKFTNFSTKSIIGFINMYAKQCTSIGKTIGSHALRRTFASLMANGGVPIGKLSKILGHKDIKTTMLYLYIIQDKNFDDVRKIQAQMTNG